MGRPTSYFITHKNLFTRTLISTCRELTQVEIHQEINVFYQQFVSKPKEERFYVYSYECYRKKGDKNLNFYYV